MVPRTSAELGLVDRGGQELGGARRGAEHDQVGARLRGDQQLAEQPGQPGLGGAASRRAPPGVRSPPSAGTAYTSAPEAARTLTASSSTRSRDRVAWVTCRPLRGEQVGELGLRADLVPGQQLDDLLLAGVLGGGREGGVGHVSSSRQPGEDRLLGVQAVLGLVPHHALRPVDDLARRSPCRGRPAGSAARSRPASACAEQRLVERRTAAAPRMRSAASSSLPIETQVSVTTTSAPADRRHRVAARRRPSRRCVAAISLARGQDVGGRARSPRAS